MPSLPNFCQTEETQPFTSAWPRVKRGASLQNQHSIVNKSEGGVREQINGAEAGGLENQRKERLGGHRDSLERKKIGNKSFPEVGRGTFLTKKKRG